MASLARREQHGKAARFPDFVASFSLWSALAAVSFLSFVHKQATFAATGHPYSVVHVQPVNKAHIVALVADRDPLPHDLSKELRDAHFSARVTDCRAVSYGAHFANAQVHAIF